VHEQTLRRYADQGLLRARRLNGHRVFALEDLDRFIDNLPAWYADPDGGPGERSPHGH